MILQLCFVWNGIRMLIGLKKSYLTILHLGYDAVSGGKLAMKINYAV